MDRERLLADHPEYSRFAYDFIERVVPYTVKLTGEVRHVSGLELLKGFRALAAQEFGDMAHLVLSEWGVHSAIDVGRMVYLLIEYGFLAASDDDDPKEFEIDFALATELRPAPENVRRLEKIA